MYQPAGSLSVFYDPGANGYGANGLAGFRHTNGNMYIIFMMGILLLSILILFDA